MKTQNILNRLGLIISIIGVLIMFIWAPPQPDHSESFGLGLVDATVFSDGKTVAEHKEETKKRKQKYIFNSKLSLALIGIGFGFQFVSTFCKD